MSASDIRIATARGLAEARREELLATIDEIKLRLAPATMAHDAWEGAKGKGSEVATTTIASVRERPALAAAIAAGAALLIARKPIFGLVSGLFGKDDEFADDINVTEPQE